MTAPAAAGFVALLPFVLLGGICGLDVVSFPQAMISRPIVAATVAGALAGRAGLGLLEIPFHGLSIEVRPIMEFDPFSQVQGKRSVSRIGNHIQRRDQGGHYGPINLAPH